MLNIDVFSSFARICQCWTPSNKGILYKNNVSRCSRNVQCIKQETVLQMGSWSTSIYFLRLCTALWCCVMYGTKYLYNYCINSYSKVSDDLLFVLIINNVYLELLLVLESLIISAIVSLIRSMWNVICEKNLQKWCCSFLHLYQIKYIF